MKILYQDLIKLLSDNPSKKILSQKLFQLGHEHEIDGDIFNMELTPNRGDCLSLVGLARDLNIFFDYKFEPEIYQNKIDQLDFDFENHATSHCPKISFLEIEIDETPEHYEPYIESYFSKLNNNKINFFTDISNYVSYELGQPTHCFNRESINDKLIFNYEECSSVFQTLLGSQISLSGNNCIFSLKNEIISLAGVMGGASTACSKDTKKVLVECAYFNPESIIGKSIRYNLVSEAAHKFERGVDIQSQEKTLRRFIKIVQDHTKIIDIKFKSYTSKEITNKYIPTDFSAINRILGTNISENEYYKYLDKLGFTVDKEVKVPSYRHDICSQNDLAEEIARVIGYDNIVSKPLNLNVTKREKYIDPSSYLRNYLAQNGFTEIINFPFSNNKNKNSLTIDNPLDSTRSNLRLSLRESLINNLLYNERRQKDSIKLYEISNIYYKNTNIKNKKVLGIIISGRLGHNYNDFSKKLDKEYLNSLMNKDLREDFFKIEEISRSDLETKKKDKIFYIETELENIPESFFKNEISYRSLTKFIRYQEISEYPESFRDFSFSITNLSLVKKVMSHIEKIDDDLVKEYYMFDFFKDKRKQVVKIGYRFIFQSSLKTLSDKDINILVDSHISPILEMEGVFIDGM